MLHPVPHLSEASICMNNPQVAFFRGSAFISEPLEAVACFYAQCCNTYNIYTGLDHQQHSIFTPPISQHIALQIFKSQTLT